MTYLPLIFIPIALLNAVAYGYIVIWWWCLAAILFVPVQLFVTWASGFFSSNAQDFWEEGDAPVYVAMWGALAAWPVWQFAIVLGLILVLCQSVQARFFTTSGRVSRRERRNDQIWKTFFATAIAVQPVLVKLDLASDETASVPVWIWVSFMVTCAVISLLLLHHAFRPRDIRREDDAR
jgi:hypothetical protein